MEPGRHQRECPTHMELIPTALRRRQPQLPQPLHHHRRRLELLQHLNNNSKVAFEILV
jgi:hypothetical protein